RCRPRRACRSGVRSIRGPFHRGAGPTCHGRAGGDLGTDRELPPRVKVWRSCEVCELFGDTAMTAVEIHDLASHERRVVDSSAPVLLVGVGPPPAWGGGR